MGLSLDQMLAVETPFFRLSLAKTLAPRHFFLLKRTSTGRRVQLNDMLGYSDEKYCKEVADCEFEEYKEWLDNDWPSSEEHRTLFWVQPKPSGRFRGRSSSEPKSQDRRGKFRRDSRRRADSYGRGRRGKATRAEDEGRSAYPRHDRGDDEEGEFFEDVGDRMPSQQPVGRW